MLDQAAVAPFDSAADELCAVLDGVDIISGQDGDSLIIDRMMLDRWKRQIGRALLVLDDAANEPADNDTAPPTDPSVKGS